MLTPKVLRDAADKLASCTEHDVYGMKYSEYSEFMCNLMPYAYKEEFSGLLKLHGVSADGGLYHKGKRYASSNNFTTQALRFDFLNLLAHSIEGNSK